MLTIDAGSPVLIEVQFSKAEPFKSYVSFDPGTCTYATYDSTGTAIVDASASGSLSKVANDAVGAGRYYCIIKTTTSWANGEYTVKITSSYGSEPNIIGDVDVKEAAFTVVNGE